MITGLIGGCEKFAFDSDIVQNKLVFRVYIKWGIHPAAILFEMNCRS